jgi:iron(III) transport system permease protein
LINKSSLSQLVTKGGVALLLAPFALLLYQALQGVLVQGEGVGINLKTLAENAFSTFLLVFCVAIFTLIIGVGTGFLVGLCAFKGRKLLSFLLLLPLAMPAYLVAFSYGDLLDNFGPLQQALRLYMGYKTRKDYYFPEIRSFWGAVWLFSLTLYPYVYLAARLAFERQAARLLEAGLVLGATHTQALRRIAFKIALPASLSGLTLVMFEVLNDIGLVTYCAVPTLSTYSLTLWLERGNLAGASFIALLLIGLILSVLKFMPRIFAQNSTPQLFKPFLRFSGYLPFFMGFLPVFFGFIAPFIYILFLSLTATPVPFVGVLKDSLLLALMVCGLTLSVGYGLSRTKGMLQRLAALGYALPGSVLALGLLGLYAQINAALFLGTSLGLVLALSFRFIALAMTQFQAARGQLSPHLHHAAASLGASPWRIILRIELPLLNPALKAAMVLIFIDCLKELPLTFLLRPVGLETLSLAIFESAQRGAFETSAFLALILVVLGLISIVVTQKN